MLPDITSQLAFTEKLILNLFPQYQELLQVDFLGNALISYIFSLFLLLIYLLVFKILQVIILGKLKKLALKTKTDLDDTAIKVVRTLKPPFYSFLAFYLAIQTLNITEVFSKVVSTLLVVWIVYQAIHAVQILIEYAAKKKLGADDTKGSQAAISFLQILSKITLWSFGFLFILSNVGVNVTSLIAGLGVGGIAVAFALQKILGDLFSSFAIYFDRPFVPGDFIVVGDKMGVVQKVGIKTTRLRALQGEEIVMSNTHLTSSTIQNFKKMEERRVVIKLGLTYDTKTEKLEKVPHIIQKIISSIEGVRFDRAHFNNFGNSALDIEIVYYVGTGEYTTFMNINQKIHLAIKNEFEKEKIDFAFPTQTVHIEK